MARQLAGHPEIKVAIEGHTDPSGDAESNLELSQRRAEGVRDQLVTLGLNSGPTPVIDPKTGETRDYTGWQLAR